MLFMLACEPVMAVKQSHFIHWNTTNPMFRIDNTDHIIDVNMGNKPWEYDQVNIICPVYRPGGIRSEDKERAVIYSVTKEEYDTCRITQPNPRVIAICDKPHELMYFTITFRSFTPTPGGMEFVPGRDYYFISTSSKANLYQRVGGWCSTHHMKVAFKVADNVYHREVSTSDSVSKAVNAPRGRTRGHRPPLRPPSPFPVPGPGTYTNRDSAKQDQRDLYRGPSYQPRGRHQTASKKRNEFEVHPNEVVKQKASPLSSSASSAIVSNLSASVLLMFLITMSIYRFQ